MSYQAAPPRTLILQDLAVRELVVRPKAAVSCKPLDKNRMTCHSILKRWSVINTQSNGMYKRYAKIMLLFVSFLFFFAANLSAQAPASSSPAIMVQIRCKGGTAELWLAEFEKEILPSIHEAINKGDGITKFSYFEAALPGQPFDFVLVFEVKTLGSLDTKRPFPHYVALFRRVGPARGEQVLSEMTGWEQDVKVTIVRSHNGQP